MINFKRLTNQDIFRATKVWATVSGVLNELGEDGELWIEFFKENHFEIFELARESDSLGTVKQINLVVKEGEDEYDTYQKWATKHDYIFQGYQILDETTCLDRDIERILYNEAEGL